MSRLVIICLVFILSSPINAESAKPPLILLSVDGFSHDYLTTYHPKNILNFAKTGVVAKLLPVYPSKTFPNHLSIITGVYPQKHGLLHNKFYHPGLGEMYRLGAGKNNSAWLTAKSLWSIAEENKITSAVYFWPESEVIGQGRQPTYNIPYNRTATDKEHFDQIIDWLKLPNSKAPKLILSYFSSVDDAGHNFGLGSVELAQAITNIDDMIGKFMKRLQQEIPQPVNVILLSDHGMVQIDRMKNIKTSMVFNDTLKKMITDKMITVAQSSTQLYVYFAENMLIKQQKSVVEQIKLQQKINSNLYLVYHKKNYPEHWEFNTNLEITPDLVIEAEPSATFINEKYAHSNLATHGYDPINQDELNAVFLASGPDFIIGKEIAPFENIHIVPLMAHLLGLKPLDNIDGKFEILSPIIK